MAVIVLKERLTAWRKIGIVLIIAGAVMVAGLGPGDFGGRESIGQAIFLSATLLWAAYTVALRRARLDGLHATAIACVASLIVYIPIYLALFGPRVLAAPWYELVWQGLYQGVLTGVGRPGSLHATFAPVVRFPGIHHGGLTMAARKTATKRKPAAKRELINTGTNKLYVRRNERGTSFKEVVDVSRSLASDRRRKAKTIAKPGQGDRGDRRKR